MRELTIVTTAGRPDEKSEQLVQSACHELGIRFEPRKKRSVSKMASEYDAHIIVAGKNRYEYYPKGAVVPFFFHPNSAAFRLKRVARGEGDPMLQACDLQKGDWFLDCTLGIGSDSMLASFSVGETGRVVGLEANPNVAFIVLHGMKTYDTTELPLTECMRTIDVVTMKAVDYLKRQPDNSFDVVYLDPMFEEVIEESNNFEALRSAGDHYSLTEEWVNEAVRVAKKRVVLKAHYKSEWFQRFNFIRDIRLSAKFHYGVIEI
ncbi:class I SAM-dependent methyltransferase [Lysinibacillus sp. 54212]|uniref:class I SAM-dependent methyltransferase n=1 Tax=Lysinibacillus sp. 54212 TaxID=3119829 RepID=UPI002FCBA4D0